MSWGPGTRESRKTTAFPSSLPSTSRWAGRRLPMVKVTGISAGASGLISTGSGRAVATIFGLRGGGRVLRGGRSVERPVRSTGGVGSLVADDGGDGSLADGETVGSLGFC